MHKIFMALLACMLTGSAFSQDKSNHILLIHAAQYEAGSGGAYPNDGGSDESYYSYRSSSDSAIQYTAEYLKGMLELSSGSVELEVDYHSEANANSLADVYYDPQFSSLRDQIELGYKYVIFFDSEQAFCFPEVMYEASSKLSKLVLDSGGTPLLMMFRSDHVDVDTLGEYTYRAGNGAGVGVIPAGYAFESAGLQGRQLSQNRAKQAMISASAIFRTITGEKAEDLGYVPTYEHMGISEVLQYTISNADISTLTTLATSTVDVHKTTSHYNTSYENDGAVVYRNVDLSSSPFENTIRYFYKGSSTHDFTSTRLGTMISGASLASVVSKFGNQSNGSRYWTTADTTLRSGDLIDEENAEKGLFLFVSGSDPGALAQDLIDLSQPNLTPLVFDWIKAFESTSGTTSTTHALNGQNCADLWSHYHFRDWKTIPVTIGMGRLNEAIANFSASDDKLHSSDPLVYLNASMMIASATGMELPVTTTLPIRDGSWTQDQLQLAITMGHDLVKELAYMSETSAYVPDSDLAIDVATVPEIPLNENFSYQLTASGGDGNYSWEIVSSSELPGDLSISSDGVLSGIVSDDYGSFNLGVQVTDGTGAFRKAGMKLTVAVPQGEVSFSTDISAETERNYGTDAVAVMYSDTLTAPDGLATFRVAISVNPMEGTSITSSAGLWGINSGEAASGWWNTFDGSLSESVDSISNIQIVDFSANGSELTVDDFIDLSFRSVTVAYANNKADRVKIVAGGVSNATNGQKMSSSPATIDIQQLAGSDSVASFTLENGNVGNDSDRWNVSSIEVDYTIDFPFYDSLTEWAAGFGLSGSNASATADVENGSTGDGYSNLLEFALGMNPTQSDAGVSETQYTEQDGDDSYFVYEYERRTDYLEKGLSYSLTVTEDLATPSVEVPFDVEVDAAVDGFETIRSRFPIDVEAKFIQLEVQRAE